ncbi:alpha/beta hydrolase [uncultured Roseobacter sp.]|uniref:alpha/beta fold hydrolase n=1 Tax=uncultured Roseobacter sp. TaxID=114847 RepID=UPI0026145F1F|nr:alpha/beta hydrolase [uncultured Roseobacter sp.]
MSQTKGFIVVDTAGPVADWMVLVHGISQDHRLFDAQVRSFQTSYRLLLIDLPGHGVSSDIPAPYGLRKFAVHIRDCMVSTGANNATFWGTHLGASAGLLAACDEPDLFFALVLESPVFPGRGLPSVSNLLSDVAATAKEQGMMEARDLWWEKGPWFDLMRSDPERFRAAEQRRIIEDFKGGPWLEKDLASKPLDSVEDKLRQLQVPTILINGEHDVKDFVLAADAMEELIPNSKRIAIPGGGGFPLWELPDLVNELVSDALADATSIHRSKN